MPMPAIDNGVSGEDECIILPRAEAEVDDVAAWLVKVNALTALFWDTRHVVVDAKMKRRVAAVEKVVDAIVKDD